MMHIELNEHTLWAVWDTSYHQHIGIISSNSDMSPWSTKMSRDSFNLYITVILTNKCTQLSLDSQYYFQKH
jgi:hypothetical protein